MRLRRTLLGYSQEKLGNAVGLTFQQIQKYERGANRISASRLYQFSKILNVPVAFFFDAMPPDVDADQSGAAAGGEEAFDQQQLAQRETAKLVRAYYAIADPAVRHRIYQLTRSVALMYENAGLDLDED